MKTKKIFSLLAMTAVLAGCSQDELISVNEKTSIDLGNRPVVGNVSFSTGVGTRMAIKDGSSLALSWEEGDKIGAAIIDQIVSTSVQGKGSYTGSSWSYLEYIKGEKKSGVTAEEAGLTAQDFYETVEFISTNYPYTRAEGLFTTPANLVEGNYMFYAPYDASHLMRNRIDAVLPALQDCSDAVMKDTKYKGAPATVSSTVLDQFYAGTMEGFEKAPVAVGYQFLAAPKDGSVINPDVEMNHLYAFPMITIVNDFNGYFYGETNATDGLDKTTATMTIDSIQIYSEASAELWYKAPIKSETVVEKLAARGDWAGARFTTGANTDDILDASAKVESYPYFAVASELSQPKLSDANSALAYKQKHVTCVIGKELKNGEKYHFHSILPAADYAKSLKARIFVTIGDKRYVIAKATNSKNGDHYESADWSDFVFQDKVNGDQNCQLVRGEHFPKVEYNEAGNATKAFAGEMMTLKLADGTAFELKEVVTPPITADNGIKDNADLINYLNDYVQRGVAIKEVAALKGVERAEWKTYSNGVTPAAGNIAFADDNTCVIDAQLITNLKQQTIVTGSESDMFTLTATSLPIAGDVKYTVSGDEYTFSTLDGNLTYTINMTGVTFGTTGDALVAGVNNIGTSSQSAALTVQDMKVAEGVTNAVAYLAGATGNVTTVTLKDATGISAIYVNEYTELKVEGVCDALIIADGGTITLGNNASLTNENNEFGATTIINNSHARSIAGTLADATQVKAAYLVWPTTAIPAASKINDITINPAVDATITIEQAQIAVFANLSDVALTLGNNVTGIASQANVILTNLKSLTGNSIKWTTTNPTGITVTKAGATITSVDAETGVTFAD